MLRGAVFDFDGTLFDSMYIWESVAELYLQSQGVTPHPGYRDIFMTMCLPQIARCFIDDYGIRKTVAQIMDEINKIVEDYYFHTALPKPHIESFLSELQNRGVRICIATATDRYQIEAALHRCNMVSYFSDILTCTEVGHGKDEPIIFREALTRMGTTREDTLIFEDAAYAIRTAKADGFSVAGIYDPYEAEPEVVRQLTDFYLPDYENTADFWAFALDFFS